jgi:hypothetical protein
VVRTLIKHNHLWRNVRVDWTGLAKRHHILHLNLRPVHFPNTLAPPPGLWSEIISSWWVRPLHSEPRARPDTVVFKPPWSKYPHTWFLNLESHNSPQIIASWFSGIGVSRRCLKVACLWNWTVKSGCSGSPYCTPYSVSGLLLICADKSNEMLDTGCYDILLSLFELES